MSRSLDELLIPDILGDTKNCPIVANPTTECFDCLSRACEMLDWEKELIAKLDIPDCPECNSNNMVMPTWICGSDDGADIDKDYFCFECKTNF